MSNIQIATLWYVMTTQTLVVLLLLLILFRV